MMTKKMSLARKYFLAAFTTGLLLPIDSHSQGAKVEVGENVQVSLSHADLINSYVTVAADPTNAKRLLAGALICDDPAKGVVHAGVYQSSDGGKTWTVSLEEPKQSETSDCTIAFGRDGNVYFADINGEIPGWRLFHSGNAGKMWNPPTFIPDNIDRPFLIVDNTAGPFASRVYCAAVVFADALGGTGGSLNALGLYHSADNGKTVDMPPTLRVAGQPFYMSGTGNCVVLSDGTLIALYGCHTDKWNVEMKKRNPSFEPKDGAFIGVGRSNDGGRAFQKKMKVISPLFPPLWHSEVYGMIAVDPASKDFRDRLYVVWTTHAGTKDQVMFSRSADGGKTWSQPVSIVDQEAGQEEQIFDAFLPCVAVNKAGVVAVTWYDTRGVKNQNGWNVRLRTSLDGGATWQPSVRVSSVTSDFNGKVVPGTTRPEGNGPETRGNDATGHTSGLVAGADGAFHPVWVDNRTGIRQVWTATVSIHSTP